MTYRSFNSELFQRFPAMKTASDREFDYFGDEEPGCYLTFEDILVPEIKKAASSNPGYLRELMAFVEETAAGDSDCQNLVAIGLGEVIATLANEAIIRAAAGPATRRAIRRGERAHGMDESPLYSLIRRVALPRKRKN